MTYSTRVDVLFLIIYVYNSINQKENVMKTYYYDNSEQALGSSATEKDCVQYFAFVEKWLAENGHKNTQVEDYSGFLPPHLTEEEKEEQRDLTQEIWDAYCAS